MVLEYKELIQDINYALFKISIKYIEILRTCYKIIIL